MLTSTEKSAFYSAIRQLLYCAGCFGVTFLEHAIAAVCKEKTFDENGILENLQLGELLLACVLFFVVSFCRNTFHRLGIVFASLCLFAGCRELDSFFDDRIPLIGWKFAFLFIALAVAYAMKNWRQTREELFMFFRHPAFIMMCCTITVVIPLAQCVGHRSFVLNVLQIDHIGSIKEFIEESLETAGYFILFCSAIELFFPSRQSNESLSPKY